MKLRKKISRWIVSLLAAAAILLLLLPVVFILFNSLKTKPDYLESVIAPPSEVYWGNYFKILTEYDFPRMFLNSLLLTGVSVFACSYIGAMAAFAIGKFRFKGRAVVKGFILPLMSIPGVVLLIPLFVMFTKMNLTNHFLGPILIYTALILPFTINIMASFMSSIPNSLLEAAMIDGSSWLGMFHRIVLPLLAPGISAATIVNTMWIWNELLFAFVFLQDESKRTLIVGLTSLQGLFNQDVPLLMAGAMVASAPVIILYIFSQKWFIRGLSAGGVK